MMKYNLKKVITIMTLVLFVTPNASAFAENINGDKLNELKIGEKYDEVRASDKKISTYNYNADDNIEVKKEVKEKLEAMEGYKLLKTKTNDSYEVALAYSDGSYSYVDSADTLEEAKVRVKNLEKEYNDDKVIPCLLNSDGQVVYATNSMGRVWNHRDGEAILDSSLITYIYSNPEAVTNENKAFTYINQGYIDDVPIIEDLGNKAKIQVNGYNGWIDKGVNPLNYDLVVVPINQVTNPSCYYIQDGSLFHYISRNMTSEVIDGYAIRIGKAPSFMEYGKDYYSYDGLYFYSGQSIGDALNKLVTDLKNNTSENSVNPKNANYNYYQYLPFRTKTNYTANELNMFIDNSTEPESKLRGLGEVFMECEKLYGVNPILALGVAINESGWGMSKIAQEKNNLFGINAVDFNPGESANSFATPAESVKEFTKNYISRGYADPADWRYFGGYLGNKALGANVKYASDPFWGEKAAQHAYNVDYRLSNSNTERLYDYNGYQLGTYTGANEVKDANGNLLYNINPSVSGWGGYAGNIVAFKFNEITPQGNYKIFPERTTVLNGGGDSNRYHGNYDWSTFAYINSANVKLINEQRTAFIPGYSIEDVDKNGMVDVLDLADVSLKYNNLSNEPSYKNYFDLNRDGIIDLFDLVMISKQIS